MAKRTLAELTDAEIEIVNEYVELFELTEDEALAQALSEGSIQASSSNFVYAPEGFAELKYYVVNPKSTLYKLNKALKKDKQDELFEEDTFYYDIQVKKTEDKKDFDLPNCKATKVGEVPKIILTKVTYKAVRSAFDKQGNAEPTNFDTTLATSIYPDDQKQMMAYGGAEGNVYNIIGKLKKEFHDGKQGKTQENVPDKLKVKFRVIAWGLVEIDGEWKKFWMDLSNRYSPEENLISVWEKEAVGVKSKWLSELQITGSDNFDNPIIQVIPIEQMSTEDFKEISKEVNATTREVLQFIDAQKASVTSKGTSDEKPKDINEDASEEDSEDPFGSED